MRKPRPKYTNEQIEALINSHIHSARDREILKARLMDGVHFEDLSQMFELSVTQVKNIVYDNEKELFKFL